MASIAPKSFRELINAEIPDKLWHYTDFSGFHGIVKSKRIYATHIRHLNDRAEFHHGIGIAKEMLEGVVAQHVGDDDLLKTYLPEIVLGLFQDGGVLSHQKLNVFTASFTLLEDRLSQWRSYSKGSSGVSLGFDLRAFRPPEDSGTLATFAPCVYDDYAKRDLIQQTISEFAENALALSQSVTDPAVIMKSLLELQRTNPGLIYEEAEKKYLVIQQKQIQKQLDEAQTLIAGKILRLAALLKHSAFDEEHEWRFALPTLTNRPPTQDTIRFRSRHNTLVPYIPFRIFGMLGEAEVLPLTDVIIGPGADFDIAIDAARTFLESEGIKNVEPRRSNIPYNPS
jgi:hypothetical protein